MEIIPSVKLLETSNVFTVKEVDLKLPEFGKGVSRVKPRIFGCDSSSSRVVHCVVEDHAVWHRLISEKLMPQCRGNVVVFDCSYRWGNHGRRAVVIDEGLEDVSDLVNKMANIGKLAGLAGQQDRPLSLVVVQDLGVYYWKLRDSKKYEGLKGVYQMCDQLAAKYGCWVVTSNWKFS